MSVLRLPRRHLAEANLASSVMEPPPPSSNSSSGRELRAAKTAEQKSSSYLSVQNAFQFPIFTTSKKKKDVMYVVVCENTSDLSRCDSRTAHLSTSDRSASRRGCRDAAASSSRTASADCRAFNVPAVGSAPSSQSSSTRLRKLRAPQRSRKPRREEGAEGVERRMWWRQVAEVSSGTFRFAVTPNDIILTAAKMRVWEKSENLSTHLPPSSSASPLLTGVRPHQFHASDEGAHGLLHHPAVVPLGQLNKKISAKKSTKIVKMWRENNIVKKYIPRLPVLPW